MDTGRFRESALFGLIAAAGLLIKGNAGCLVLLPVFALLIGRRFDLLLKPAFWVPVPIVAILAGPWYYLTWGLTAQGFRNSLGPDYVSRATFANTTFLLHSVGPVIFVLAVIALVRMCGRFGTGDGGARPSNLQVCAASLLIAVFVFLLVVPSAIAARYVLAAVPPILILATMEAGYWSDWISRRYSIAIFQTEATWRMAVFAILAISFVTFAFQIPSLPDEGFAEAAQQIGGTVFRKTLLC